MEIGSNWRENWKTKLTPTSSNCLPINLIPPIICHSQFIIQLFRLFNLNYMLILIIMQRVIRLAYQTQWNYWFPIVNLIEQISQSMVLELPASDSIHRVIKNAAIFHVFLNILHSAYMHITIFCTIKNNFMEVSPLSIVVDEFSILWIEMKTYKELWERFYANIWR